MRIKKKRFKSLDGEFDDRLSYISINNTKNLKNKRLSIVGKGNSISSLPFVKNSLLIDLDIKKEIKVDIKRKILSVTGNFEAYEAHNYLLKNKLFFPSFPSYPSATVGACVANCTHGISPRFGLMRDFVLEIEIFNPNFGKKTLSRTKNKKLFELTIGGMGLTGIILRVRLKVLDLKGTFIKIENNKNYKNLKNIYNYLRNNKYIYNHNNLFFNFKEKNSLSSRISSGNILKGKFSNKSIINKDVSNIRMGIFNYSILRKLLEYVILFKEYVLKKNIMHINDAFYPSNSRLLYFNLMPKRFMEHQTIIPHRNVYKFFEDFKSIAIKYSPMITLLHFKIFNGKGKYLQFNGKGLGLTVHFIIDKKFEKFYKKFLDINYKYSCKLNLYKNSLIKLNDIKKFYGRNFFSFCSEIKKINRKFIIENRIFNKKNFYK